MHHLYAYRSHSSDAVRGLLAASERHTHTHTQALLRHEGAGFCGWTGKHAHERGGLPVYRGDYMPPLPPVIGLPVYRGDYMPPLAPVIKV